MIASKQIAFGGSAKGLSAKDYVQDGLIAMWDGIENAGWGVHDDAATVWKDLAGAKYGDMEIVSGTWNVDCFNISDKESARILGKQMSDHVVEIVYKANPSTNPLYPLAGACIFHFGFNRHGIASYNYSTELIYSFQRCVSSVPVGRISAYLYYPQTSDIREKADPIYINGEKVDSYAEQPAAGFGTDSYMRLGGAFTGGGSTAEVCAIRIYDSIDIARAEYHSMLDKARFNLP